MNGLKKSECRCICGAMVNGKCLCHKPEAHTPGEIKIQCDYVAPTYFNGLTGVLGADLALLFVLLMTLIDYLL